ncbi:hypothetical protein ASD65_07305 [Microbacterium sp. Root61]|uniref:DUF305 domain-containing protein n=1 Tax=Microbacterium sp. Root61 TaxID=1736570 RepID=UPI0006F8495C|nr:DUF305 domain-containing protein [Microbacterium sp. Root61]KRA24248.1 hypothetical protein ASD65_07305 [Microbacterium sp. Root61]
MSEPTTPAPPRRRWLTVALACLAVAAVAFAIGRFTTFGSGEAAAVPNAADAGFARDMQVHHAQAVEMAMIAYRATEDPDLRTLAYDIATGQAGQRGEMFDWLVQWGLPQAGAPLMSWMIGDDGHAGHGSSDAPATDAELHAAMGMATDAELTTLKAATGAAGDCQFLTLMIRHHEGAIEMVDAVLELGSQPRVLQVAASMKESQGAEIDAMRAMSERLGCTP